MKSKGKYLKKQATPNTIDRIQKLASAVAPGKGSVGFSISIDISEYVYIQKVMAGEGPTKDIMTRSEATRYLIRMGWTYLHVLESQLEGDQLTPIIEQKGGGLDPKKKEKRKKSKRALARQSKRS